MDEFLILLIGLVVVAAVLSGIVLPIIALVITVRSKKKFTEQISRLEAVQPAAEFQRSEISGESSLAAAIKRLEARVEQLEAAVSHPIAAPEQAKPGRPPKESVIEPAHRPESSPESQQPIPPATEFQSTDADESLPTGAPSFTSKPPRRTMQAEQIESIIGRRWLGWVAIGLILFATAFFLKFAFDNRWIGELGRVAIGVAAGVSMCALGFRYHRRGWSVFSQILTAGGVILLYLSVYAAFGYYHLASQKAAFAYLTILVAEAAGLALLYNAPAIAIMALVGGFLAPILLRSDRDQYQSLFAYIAALDAGALALLKHWKGLSSVAFVGTHLLFWLWYGDNYHPRKLGAVMIFQATVFLLFLLAQVARQLIRRERATMEDVALLVINPFAFFATSYHLLNPDHHDWMGVFAIGMALIYAAAARVLLDRMTTSRSELLLIIVTALTFATVAIPIQLRSNWITIAWSVEALAVLWAGIQINAQRLRALALAVFGLALMKLVLRDTRIDSRPMFTPVLNKYFLSALVVTACLFAAVYLYQRLGERKQIAAPKLALVVCLIAVVTLWFVMSVETHTFFQARAAMQKLDEDARHERWLGQMALSVLWSVYAGSLAAVGFVRRSASVRWAALALFGLTVIKVILVDIAELRQFYRIIAFLVLGVLLLLVAWGYQRAFHSKE